MTVDGDGTDGGGDSELSVNIKEETEMPKVWLNLFPNNELVPENYDDLRLKFSSCVLRSLEKYLPMEMLTENRFDKALFMSDILSGYACRGEITMAKILKEYRQNIITSYQPRFNVLYNQDPELFLLPSFLKAISENTEESFRGIISEPFPSVFVFQMFRPDFLQILHDELSNFCKWTHEAKVKIRRPTTTRSIYGIVLDDFGLDIMLKKLMEEFIFPLCKVFFPEVCEAMFDSHHGFVVRYGDKKDFTESGYHTHDSEITLNVCLSKQFEGGELCFRGVRCKKHLATVAKPEETFDCCQIPGQAILYRGCHRNGTTATTSGFQANMILWCRNSLFSEMETYQKDFSDWCGQCAHETKEKESQILAAKRKEMIRIESEADTA